MIEMKLEGMDLLKKQLEQLGALTQAKLLAKAGRKALKPVLDEMRATVPVDTGLLRDSLRLTVKKAPKGSNAAVVIGIYVKVGKGGGSRDIRKAVGEAIQRGDPAKKAQREAWRKSAHWRWHFVELGTSKKAARPFIRPAFNRNAQKMLDTLRDELWRFIKKELQKTSGTRKAPSRKAA